MNTMTSNEWQETTLDQLGRIVTGKTPSSRNHEYFGGGIPFVTPSDFDETRLIDSTERHLTRLGADAVKGAQIPSEAVMVTCIGSQMGQSAMTTAPSVTNQQINSIIVHPGNDALFIYYNLSNRREEIRSLASGSAVPILNKSAFGQLKISLPTLPVQQSIAHVLGTLDDKIKLNRRMNRTLEEMARVIFQDWFVDFGPTRAKMGGQEPYLPPELWDLFPDRLVDSELGEIPEGWGAGLVSQISKLIFNGGTPKRSEVAYWVRGAIPWLTSGEVRQSFVMNTQEFITQEGLTNSSAKIVPERSILVALYGATAGQICMNFRPLSTNQAISAIVPIEGSRYFCLVSLQSKIAELQNRAVGSAQQNISKREVESTNLLLPQVDLRSIYDAFVTPLFDRIFRNLDESSVLTAQRDALLPRLVSGEVRV